MSVVELATEGRPRTWLPGWLHRGRLTALPRGLGGRPGALTTPLHDAGSAVRLAPNRRQTWRCRTDRLPHLPA